jgi:hypothetical protein
MKKITFLLLILVLSTNSSWSQNRCDRSLKIAKKYLEKKLTISEALRLEIAQSVDSCYSDTGLSFYVKGLLEFRKNPSPNYEGAFNSFNQSAQLGYTRAKTFLGYIYKNGLGVPTDLNKSLSWITEAANDGEDNALYTLGYYHLKGMAGLEADYEVAVSYFEQSEHHMAKHWLAFCKFYGFGIDKDEYEAENILETNHLPDSENLLAFLDNNFDHEFANFESESSSSNYSNFFNAQVNDTLYGVWLEKDWKNEKVLRELPIVLHTISADQNSSKLSLLIEEANYVFDINSLGELITPNFTLTLQAPFTNPSEPEYLHYKFQNATVKLNNETGIYSMNPLIWIDEYKEKSSPVTMRIYSEEALKNRINNSFILYPTIFNEVLNFSFEIEYNSSISMSLYDLSGNLVANQVFGSFTPGKHDLQFNSNQVQAQNYIAVLHVNNLRFARQVLKSN